MRKALVVQRGFIKTSAGGDINFDADDGFDTGLGGLIIKLNGSEHGAMIGGGHRVHAEISSTLQHVVNANGAVQQAVLGMNMEMDEIGCVGYCHEITYLLF